MIFEFNVFLKIDLERNESLNSGRKGDSELGWSSSLFVVFSLFSLFEKAQKTKMTKKTEKTTRTPKSRRFLGYVEFLFTLLYHSPKKMLK